MKMLFKTGAVVLAMSVALIATQAQAQKLLNGSFEDPEQEMDNPYGDLAAHWGRWGCWINRESAWKPVRDGKCLIGYHHWEIEEASESGIYQDIEGAPSDAECTFTIEAYKDSGSNAESVELRIEKAGGYETLASKIFPLSELKGNGWQKLSVTGRTGAEGVRVLVVVKPASDGERKGALKFDDAALKFRDGPEQTGRGRVPAGAPGRSES